MTKRIHGPQTQISLLEIAQKLPLNKEFTSKEFGLLTGHKPISCAPKTKKLANYGFLTRKKEDNRFVKYTMNFKQQKAMVDKYNQSNTKVAKINASRIKKKLSVKEWYAMIDEARMMYCEHILRKSGLI